MHPDAIIDALHRELSRLDKDAEDFPERKQAIHDEIDRVDALERPATAPEKPDTVVDHVVGYLAGLRQELSRAAEDRKEEIEAEIKRVEADLGNRGDVESAAEATDEPTDAEAADETTQEADVNDVNLSPEEIEARKQARAAQAGGVEQARSAPVPGQPVPAETPSTEEQPQS